MELQGENKNMGYFGNLFWELVFVFIIRTHLNIVFFCFQIIIMIEWLLKTKVIVHIETIIHTFIVLKEIAISIF